ncbi:hypothetical protein INT44_008425 [Umbelopsis vinacea]|uniref:Protein Zds1 C-terminal domain-containing protein n=1 Tax=Umbelopsis vinacea TaxID=44442 RepID=A0A8H7UFZ0_9FUNG|nr:hypothetical protein INT44_008425 [Umbelopsis vinacea]
MDMRTDAQELSTQAMNRTSANLTDKNTIHDNHDQKGDDNVDTSSKKSDSGIYMEAKAEGHIMPVSPVRMEDRDEQSATREHLSADYQDEANSYTEDSASIMSNTTTISSLMDDEDEGKQVYNIETTNPSRLFWVPAEQHPEIAPAEFANWLQTHGVIRGKGQVRVRRKRSILAVSYLPGEEDDDEDDEQAKEHPRQHRRTHSSTTDVTESQPFVSNVVEHPILEEQEETEPDSTVTSNNDRIRRTVSLYSPVATVGRQSSTSSKTLVFDRHSSATDESPVIVPRVEGSLLRRAARTRIRRTSLSGSQPGEAGKRFGNRRSQSIHAKPSDYPERFGVVPPGGITLQDRPVSISEIIDFGGPEYEPAESQQGIITRVHDAETEVFSRIAAEENQQKEMKAAKPDVTETAVPSHILDENVITETAEVIIPTAEHVNIPTTTQAPEDQLEVITPSSAVEHKTQPDNQIVLTTKPKVTLSKTDSKSIKSSSSPFKPEKRSSWSFKFLSDDKSKKKQQHKQHLTSDSLQRVPSSSSTISTASNASSTGSSKSKLKDTNEIFSNPAKKLGLSHLFQRTNSKAQKANINGSSVMVKKSAKSNDMNVANDDFSRFPVHVERAIYRLSHYKLSNPRRPLHHQVLISNLMFWYLSIINGQKIRQQASPHQSGNTPPPESPPPSSFIIQSQNNYQEEQEATPAKLGKVGRFISASKKRRQEIIEKKQIQQQHHHQPRWLPPIFEGSAQADGHVEDKEKTSTHVTFVAPKTGPRTKEDVDERVPQTRIQTDVPQGSQLVTSKRPSDNRYSPIPNQHYQPSQQTIGTHEAITSESAPVNPHPLPPIPGPPILSHVSSFDSFTDDILNSLGLEGQHASEDDDVPLALYRNQS